MSWEKIEDHLFDKYCVEGEDKELGQLMKEHDEELKKEFASELKKLFTDFLHIEDIDYYKEDIYKIIKQAQENMNHKKLIESPYKDIHIKTNKEKYCVFISNEYNSNHEYQFSNKEEFLKFVDGQKATDRYGEEVEMGYYEHIEQAYTKGEIDVMALYDELNKNINNDMEEDDTFEK